jgi:Domain of unknown function (DUF4158)
MLDMLSWHVPYLGWTRLPTEISEFEITHFFSLRPAERSAVLTQYRDSLRLGAGLRVGFLKMCGRPLDAIQRVPADLLKHLGEQIEIAAPTIATLRALYLKRRRTLYEHQRWAMVSERNVTDAVSQLTTRSKIPGALVSEHKLLIAGAMHDVSTGAVRWLRD